MALLPWLLLLVLLGTIYPTYQLATKSQSSFREKRLDLARVQADLDFYQVNSQEAIDLQAQIDEALAEKDALINSFGGLKLSDQKWSPTLYQIDQLLPAGASWSQITQQGSTIYLDGTADEYQLVIDLLDALKSVEGLADVEINSIQQISPEDAPDPQDSSADTPLPYAFTILATTAREVAP